MDLFAYVLSTDDAINDNDYLNKNYGKIPRLRGMRFMKVEQPVMEDTPQFQMFNKYCGQDVIYIHTRSGNCGYSWKNKKCNYRYYGADAWEKKLGDLFLDHITDEFDSTYCDHYFKAVMSPEYDTIIKSLTEVSELPESPEEIVTN